jgi:hypothetical protein
MPLLMCLLKLFFLETDRYCDQIYRLEAELSSTEIYKVTSCCFVIQG